MTTILASLPSFILPLAFVAVVVFIVLKGIKIVQQSEAVVIERLGKYHQTLNAGINIIIPFLDKPRHITYRKSKVLPDGRRYVQFQQNPRVDLRETVYDFPKAECDHS